MSVTNYERGGLTYVGELPSLYPTTAVTKTAFRNRFTFAERVAIKTAETGSAMLQVLSEDQANATFIDLADPATAQGLDLLISFTLILPARKAEILSNEILEAERPL